MSETSDEQPDQSQTPEEISQADVDALIGGDAQAETTGQEEETPAPGAGGAVGQDEIDAILNNAEAENAAVEAEADTTPAGDAPPPADTRVDTATAAAIEEGQATGAQAASTPPPAQPPGQPALETRQLELDELVDSTGSSVQTNRVTMLNDVNLRVEVELGRTRMLVEDVLQLGEGSVVELDKLAGDPVDVFVNGRLIARGEVLVLNDSFCVRVSEVLSDDPHRISK